MLFTSHEFLLFLWGVFFVFWYVAGSPRARLWLLTFASYGFYGTWGFASINDFVTSMPGGGGFAVTDLLWHLRFVGVLLGMTTLGYVLTRKIHAAEGQARKLWTGVAIAGYLLVCGFFKYAGLFSYVAAEIAREMGAGRLPLLSIALPVGIGFWTFQSISYSVDVYRRNAAPAKSFIEHAFYLSFFATVISGPIARSKDLLAQVGGEAWKRRGPDWGQVNIGLVLITMGFVKKLVIADQLAVMITPTWNGLLALRNTGAAATWMAVLGFSFQLYFDFSGYSDIATGVGHLLGLKLPQNFNSPYKAVDVGDFWRRWHMSLSYCLRDYIYIPLGGSRHGVLKQMRNILITWVLCGAWHGAGWLYLSWGLWNGTLLAGFIGLRKLEWMPSNEHWAGRWFNRQSTFLLIVLSRVFVRTQYGTAEDYGWASMKPALHALRQLFGAGGWSRGTVSSALVLAVVACWVWCNFAPNSFEVAYGVKPRRRYAWAAGAAMGFCMLCFGSRLSFLYFRF